MDWISEPYKHSIGEGYFADYQGMLDRLPADSAYEVYNSTYPLRYLYNPEKDVEHSLFWRGVLGKLKRDFGKRAVIQMCRDKPGYQIGPHTDKVAKERTYLFYLTNTEVEGAGTVLFVPKPGFSGGADHFEFKHFDVVKSAPYRPNGYFAFDRTRNSYHGVFPSDITRNIIQVSIYK